MIKILILTSIVITCATLYHDQISTELNLYVDNGALSSLQDGSSQNPYLEVTQALEVALQSSCIGSQVVIYIAPSLKPYELDNKALVFDGKNITTLSITSWTQLASERNNTQTLLDFKNSSWSFQDMYLLSISNIMINEGIHGAINLQNTTLMLTNVDCFPSFSTPINDTDSKAFITITSGLDVLISNFTLQAGFKGPFINYAALNDGSIISQVSLENVTILVDNSTITRPRIFIFKSETTPWITGFLYVHNFTIEALPTSNSVTMTPILSVSGFLEATIQEFFIRNQTIISEYDSLALYFDTSKDPSSIFYLEDIMSINIDRVNLEGNNFLKSAPKFFQLEQIGSFNNGIVNINITNINITRNYIQPKFQEEFNTFFLIDYDNSQNVTLSNHSFINNTIDGPILMIFCFLDSIYKPHVGLVMIDRNMMTISNLNISDNINTLSTHTFYYLSLQDITINLLQVQDIILTNNELPGRIFSFVLGPQRIAAKLYAFFNRINISNNPLGVDSSFLYMEGPGSVENGITEFECLEPVESYALRVMNMTVTNNNFSKGLNSLWPNEVSLFQIINVQVSINSSEISNNTFVLYDFLSIEQELSTFVMISNNVENNKLHWSQFINTNNQIPIPVCNLIFENPFVASTNIPYRFGFILNSSFSNIYLHSSTLFVLNYGFIAINNNQFQNITLIDSLLFNTAFSLFRLPTLSPTYYRSSTTEEASLSDNPVLWAIFNETIAKAYSYGSWNIFYYNLYQNNFTNISSFGENFIALSGSGLRWTVLSFEENYLLNSTFTYPVASVVSISHYAVLTIQNNNFESLKGSMVIFSLPEALKAMTLILSRNKFLNSTATAFFISQGKGISNLNVTYNTVHKVNLTKSWIYLNAKDINKDWIFENNSIDNSNLVIDISKNQPGRFGFIFILNQNIESSGVLQIINNSFQNISLRTHPIKYSSFELNFIVIQSYQAANFSNTQFFGLSNMAFGNLITFINSPTLTLDSCRFSYINFNSPLGLITLSSQATFISNTEFLETTNLDRSGIIYLDMTITTYVLQILGCKFEQSGSTILYANSTQKPQVVNIQDDDSDFNFTVTSVLNLTILNCEMEDLANMPAIYLSRINCSSCIIKNSTFTRNGPQEFTSSLMEFVYEISGYIELSNISLSPSNNSNGALINIVNSYAEIILNSLIYSGDAAQLYLAKVDSGILTIRDSIFDNITLNTTPIIAIIQMTNTPNSQSQTSHPTISLINTVFQNIQSNILQELYEDLVVKTLNYEYTPSSGTINSIIFLSTPTNLLVNNCSFEEISGLPAILFANSISQEFYPNYFTSIEISDSNFSMLHFMTGPALTVLPNSFNPNITIINSLFEQNSAYAGGAICVYNTSLNIDNLTTFVNNQALIVGAAILADENINEELLSQANFINNTATYGGDIGFEASDFTLNFMLNTTDALSPVQINNTNGLFLSNVANYKLQQGGLHLSFIDQNGRPAPVFSLLVDVNFEVARNSSLQTIFPAIYKWNDYMSSNISLRNLPIQGTQSDEVVNVNLNYSSSRFSQAKTISLQIRNCLPGEYNNTLTMVCEPCLSTQYSLLSNQTFCSPCPANANCLAQSQICPISGFWNADSNSPNIIPCRTDSINRCLNNGSCRSCATGYTGPLCEGCEFDKNYVESGYLRCGSCSDKSFIYSITIYVAYLLYQLFNINTFYTSIEQVSTDQANYLVKRKFEKLFYVKSLLTYTQLMSILYLSSSQVFDDLGLISQVGDPVALVYYGTQCSMQALNLDSSKFIYYQTAFAIASPIIQLVFFTFFLSVIRLFNKTLQLTKIIPVAAVYLVLSFQPGIISNLANFSSCTTQPGLDYSYIASHPYWMCNTPHYDFFWRFVVLPTLVMWCAVLPIGTFFILRRNKDKFETPKFKALLGIIYMDLNENFYYWGIVLIGLKVVLALLIYGLIEDVSIQIFISLVLLWGYQTLVRVLEPYKTKAFNNFETIMIKLALFNIVVVKYLFVDTNEKIINGIYFVLLLLLNGGFLILLLFKILSLTFLGLLGFVEKSIMKRKITKPVITPFLSSQHSIEPIIKKDINKSELDNSLSTIHSMQSIAKKDINKSELNYSISTENSLIES